MQNKVVLITGATSMIGSACAYLFSQQGAKLMLVGRNESKLNQLAKELTGDVNYCVANMDSPQDIKEFIDKTVALYGRIDAVIQNVAVYPWKLISELSLTEWQQTLNINLTSAFLTTQACFSVMKKQQAGNIIFISSIAGEIIGLPHMSSYAVTKAGINGLMRTAAIEFAPYNIKANSISPGRMYNSHDLEEEDFKSKIAPIPLQRFIDPKDIANMALFLIEKGENITGQNFIVDGGQSIIGENAHVQKD
jgi:3-oxoacyl-[acyl-carrier protein] reductase